MDCFSVPAWSVCAVSAACTADAVRAAREKTQTGDNQGEHRQ